jgi:hypothetical protein
MNWPITAKPEAHQSSLPNSRGLSNCWDAKCMKETRVSLIPIPADWKPETMARIIERETEKWWSEGWVFLRAETDALMESVCLYFERTFNQ